MHTALHYLCSFGQRRESLSAVTHVSLSLNPACAVITQQEASPKPLNPQTRKLRHPHCCLHCSELWTEAHACLLPGIWLAAPPPYHTPTHTHTHALLGRMLRPCVCTVCTHRGDFGRLGHGESTDVFIPRPIAFFEGRKVCWRKEQMLPSNGDIA